MSKRSYTLLEYLVALEKRINEISTNGGSSGESGSNADLTDLTNQVNSLRKQVNTLNNDISVINRDIISIESNVSTIEGNVTTIEGDVNNLKLKKTEYFYISKDNNTYSLYNASDYIEIKVYDDFNDYLLRDNENYIRVNDALTFNYINPQKIRVEYY